MKLSDVYFCIFEELNNFWCLILGQLHNIQEPKMKGLYPVLLAILLQCMHSLLVAPTWLTSSYVQAASRKLINNVQTDQDSPMPTASITFTTAFAVAPNVAYGISNYQADDTLNKECFEISRTNLSATSFGIQAKLVDTITLWNLQIRYIAISKAFPHHVNCFDNVPINYTAGPLVNISTASSSVQTYSNTISYTNQAIAAGSTYTQFSLPLTNNKLLLFMTALYSDGIQDNSQVYPQNLYLNVEPMSQSTYKISCNFSMNCQILRLHFSIIAFDYVSVQATGQYMIVYDKVCYAVTGGTYNFPSEFLTNFVMGFVEYSSIKNRANIHFILNFGTYGGNYGVQMPLAVTRESEDIPLSRYCYSIFYMKTWQCNASTFFDPSQNMCTDSCPVAHCLVCQTLTVCSTCDVANDFFLNTTSGQCVACALTGCIDCTSLTACNTCNSTANYIKLASNTCQLCSSSSNYFANPATQTCNLCTISNCVTCSSLSACSICNSAASFYLNPSKTCSYCDPAHNNFIHPTTYNCDSCNLNQCLNCSSLTACRECNQTNKYFLGTDSLCHLCTLTNCITCANLTTCAVCDTLNGYTINLATLLCEPCAITGCTNCTDTLTCAECNTTANYILTGLNCTQCSAPANFPNLTSVQCEPCAVDNCTICATLSTCDICDYNHSYYLLPGLTCGFCDPSNNSFINMTSGVYNCETCSLFNCITCSSLTSCSQCNETANYFQNSSDNNLCYACTPGNCIDCLNLTACSICDTANGYVLNASTLLCELCPPGVFPNTTSNQCEPCAVNNCTTCVTLTTCQVCDYNSSFYLLPDLSCGFCDPANNTFINMTSGTYDCEACNLTNCVTCSSLTSCSLCNETAQYFDNATDNLCYLCSIPNCASCSNLTACQVCDTANGYTLNISTLLCELCAIPGCTNCSNTETCAECNTTDNYILTGLNCTQCNAPTSFANATSAQCEPCAVDDCSTCTALSTCAVCNYNASFYLLPNSTCAFCDPANNTFINMTSGTYDCEACNLTNCVTCSSLTSCSLCNETAQYFDNATDNLCYLCSPTNCTQCLNLTACAVCDSLAGYTINLTSLLCELCSIPGCINCTDAATCVECNITDNYVLTGVTCTQCIAPVDYPNITSSQCEPCAVSNCTVCETLSICQTCDYNNSYYLLPDFSCQFCDPANNTFINLTSGTFGCQACELQNCVTCSSLTTCSQCNTSINYLLNSTDELCYPCLLSNCLQCTNFTACTLCDQPNGYFLNETTGQCEFCVLDGCVECLTLTSCKVCDTNNSYNFDHTSFNMSLCGICNVSCQCDGYVEPWDEATQKCAAECGDGVIRVDEECDDNNTDSFDGCSASCIVQSYFACVGEPSICNETLYIESEFVSIAKQGCNGFKITVSVPRLTLSQIRNNIHILNSDVTITKLAENAGLIEISAEYTRDIANETIQLHFSPGVLLNITYNPTIPALFYNQEQCNIEGQIEDMLQAAEIISYVILIISILSCKIVGLQLFGVLQLSYFTLSSHDFLNVYLAPLTKFRTFNGLNLGLTSETSQVPQNYAKMGVAGTFINNCNVMLILLVGEFIVALILYIISKILRKQKLEKLALRLMKQGFVTLVLFNIFNISFSAGVHWKYASPTDDGYILSSIVLYGTLIAMVAAVVAMEVTGKDDYGEFKNKFKNVWICQLYIPLTVVYRMVLGFYTAVKSDYDEGTLIILAFSLTFMLYIIVNLPFSNVFQNYRCSLIHLTMLYTLLTTNYYRAMKSNTPIQVKGRIYGPAIAQLILMVTCIAISFMVLAYEIYQLIKNWRGQKKTKNNQVRQRRPTQQSFENL